MAAPLALPGPGQVGLDEAGRGCLAGPVVAAAVLLPPGEELPGLDDSKKIKAPERMRLRGLVLGRVLAWGVGYAWQREIDRINVLQASLTAMGRALAALHRRAKAAGHELTELRVDGNKAIPAHLTLGLPQVTVVKGDGTELCIAAASILAKTTRDRLMERMDVRYPGYGLAGHKGYPSPAHKHALAELGPSRLHRRTFKGVLPEQSTEVELCLPGL